MFISAGFLSCKKESVAPTNSTKSPKNTENVTKSLNCSPWRDADDVQAAVVDLNEVGDCNISLCAGNISMSYLIDKVVANSTGGTLYLISFAPVTIATQNYIWSNAVSQANASAPTGFGVSKIHNFRDIAGGGLNKRMIKFDVDYIKCN
ncbi:hypothetical protein [Fluviicola sp.]|uniref:hypothetical protein n=1 Tax=Fluviicola sp. TaxID=1917219 RepID=UPI00261E0AC4|nr:hypothetical protein [Fluviicola sp.]